MKNNRLKELTTNENLTFDEREIIINQIDRIKEISDLFYGSIAIDLILFEYLRLNKDYGLIELDETDIIKRLNIENADDYIKKSLRDLCDKDILIKTVENDINYYSLNYKYFNENDI